MAANKNQRAQPQRPVDANKDGAFGMNGFFSELRRRNVVRVAGVYAVIGWVLAQVANTLEETMNLPLWFDSLIVALLIIGLPIAIIFAWAFELTPDGVKRTEAVDEGESITADTGRKLDYAIVVGLVVLVAMIIWQQASGPDGVAGDAEPAASTELMSPTNVVAVASVAVLPFADLSPAGDQEYFSDGISEEILNVLVGVEGLDVVSRTSSFQFKGTSLGIPEIASQLEVRHVVEGSVRKAGDTIRVTAQLIDAEGDRHLWSETYDRPLTAENIFAIQDEIAGSISNALRHELGMTEDVDLARQIPTENLSAYELYLQARPLFQARRNLDVVEDLLARAVEQDPDFAQAWALRAANQALLNDYGFSAEPIEAHYARGMDFAQRALSIDPRSATALATLGLIHSNESQRLIKQHDIGAILTDLDRAIGIEPRNGSALNWRGLVYAFVGDLPTADRDFQQCIEYEPLYWPCITNHWIALSAMGRDEEALQAFKGALNLGVATAADAPLSTLARLDEEWMFKMATSSPELLFGWRRHDELYHAYQNVGEDYRELVESILEFTADSPTVNKQYIQFILVPLGAYEQGTVTFEAWDPDYKVYRQSEQFRRRIREGGVLAYWQEHGFPPQCEPAGDDDFVCP